MEHYVDPMCLWGRHSPKLYRPTPYWHNECQKRLCIRLLWKLQIMYGAKVILSMWLLYGGKFISCGRRLSASNMYRIILRKMLTGYRRTNYGFLQSLHVNIINKYINICKLFNDIWSKSHKILIMPGCKTRNFQSLTFQLLSRIRTSLWANCPDCQPLNRRQSPELIEAVDQGKELPS
jgi:hypothetical protein